MMNNSNQAPQKHSQQLNKNPKSSMVINQAVTPIALNMNKKMTQHMRSPHDTVYLPNNSIALREKQFASGSDIAQHYNSNAQEGNTQLINAKGADVNSQHFESDKVIEAQQDIPSSSNNGPTLSAFDQPPTVNVIKSNAAKVVNSMTQSLVATDGETTIKKSSMIQNNYENGFVYQTNDQRIGKLHSSQV